MTAMRSDISEAIRLQSTMAGFDALPNVDKDRIMDLAKRLQDKIPVAFGRQSALITLSAIGELMERNNAIR
jgi:hypothetical protein